MRLDAKLLLYILPRRRRDGRPEGEQPAGADEAATPLAWPAASDRVAPAAVGVGTTETRFGRMLVQRRIGSIVGVPRVRDGFILACCRAIARASRLRLRVGDVTPVMAVTQQVP